MKHTMFIAVVTVSALAVSAGAGFARDAERPDFGTLDTDGDGEITRAEIASMTQSRFAANDGNGDGKLDADELVAAATQRTETRVARMIARLDKDGDGALTPAEFSARRDPGRMIDRFDADGNGSLSEAEFNAALDETRNRWARRHGGNATD